MIWILLVAYGVLVLLILGVWHLFVQRVDQDETIMQDQYRPERREALRRAQLELAARRSRER